MPNWVNNVIICKDDLVGKIIDEDGEVNFEVLIPSPTSKEQCIHEFGKEYLLDGKQGVEPTEGKEWFNWYAWNYDFWGTKWNACDAYESKLYDRYRCIQFDTPWSPPTQWINKLANLGKPFILHWTEEQGFGEQVGYNGKINLDAEWGYYEFDENDETIEDEHRDNFPPAKVLKEFFGD